jgi:hypothetical protein
VSKRKISYIGLSLVGAYVGVTALCLIAAVTTQDPKSHFVLLQLPIALQTAIIPHEMWNYLSWISWPLAYVLFALPSVFMLYAIGSLIG